MNALITWLASKCWAPINAYGPCFSVTLWRWRRKKLELWYAPADFSPEEHTHDDVSGEFTILYSKNREIYRKVPKEDGTLEKQSYIANTPEVWGKWLSVRDGTIHKFEKGDSCMIWLVWETWKQGRPVASVATDFNITKS